MEAPLDDVPELEIPSPPFADAVNAAVLDLAKNWMMPPPPSFPRPLTNEVPFARSDPEPVTAPTRTRIAPPPGAPEDAAPFASVPVLLFVDPAPPPPPKNRPVVPDAMPTPPNPPV